MKQKPGPKRLSGKPSAAKRQQWRRWRVLVRVRFDKTQVAFNLHRIFQTYKSTWQSCYYNSSFMEKELRSGGGL